VNHDHRRELRPAFGFRQIAIDLCPRGVIGDLGDVQPAVVGGDDLGLGGVVLKNGQKRQRGGRASGCLRQAIEKTPAVHPAAGVFAVAAHVRSSQSGV